jgi:soluble lytic murein transglycosylase-like protein
MQQQLADPAVNVPAGARYLSYLMDLFPGRLDLVLAAYNAGEGAVQKFGKAIPPYKETMNYVKAVTGIYEQLQAARPLSGRLAAAGSAGRGGSRIRMTLPGAAPAAADAQIP